MLLPHPELKNVKVARLSGVHSPLVSALSLSTPTPFAISLFRLLTSLNFAGQMRGLFSSLSDPDDEVFAGAPLDFRFMPVM